MPEGVLVRDLGSRNGTFTSGNVPVSELVAGDNTIELTTANTPTNYPPVLANITLIVSTR
jgi:hypothetical protein